MVLIGIVPSYLQFLPIHLLPYGANWNRWVEKWAESTEIWMAPTI